jgi:hypothetical protein
MPLLALLSRPPRHPRVGIRHLRNKCTPPIPLKTLGSCLECHDGTPADPASYIAPPANTSLAA